MRTPITFHDFLQENQGWLTVSAFRNVGFQDFPFMINRPSQIMKLSIYLHKNFVNMPAPVWIVRGRVYSFYPNFFGEDEPNRFHQYRMVSWQMSMPRSCNRSSTLRSDSGNLTSSSLLDGWSRVKSWNSEIGRDFSSQNIMQMLVDRI